MKKIVASLAVILALTSSHIALAKDSDKRPSASQQSTQSVAKVNINSANTSQLAAALNGVGLKKAEAIIEYRKKFGAFKSVDELTAVKGIGAKTLEKNRSKIAL